MYQPFHLLFNLSIQGKDQLICNLYKPLIYDVQNVQTSQSTDASISIQQSLKQKENWGDAEDGVENTLLFQLPYSQLEV